MQVPSYAETAAACRTMLSAALPSGVQIIPEGAEYSPALSGVTCTQRFLPSSVEQGELGGKVGLSLRHGIYFIVLSAPFGTAKGKAAALFGIAEAIMAAFRHAAAETTSGTVYFGEPSAESIGKDADGRFAVSISVPWTTWTGGTNG